MAKIPFKRKSIGDEHINETTLTNEHSSEEEFNQQEEERELQAEIARGLNDSNNSSFIKNLRDQKTVSLDDTKGSAKESKVINFMEEEEVLNYTASESKKSENTQNKDAFAGKSSEDIRNEIKAEEERSKNSYTPDEMKEFASFIILLIDTIFSNALKWWSKDTSVTAYSLSKPSQDKLTKSLTYILIKYQAKFSIEWMFFITMIFMYAPPFLAANARRKDVQKAEQAKAAASANTLKQKQQQQQQQQQQQHQQTQQTYTETKKEVVEEVFIPEVIHDDVKEELPKRKNSRPRRTR